MNSYSTQIEGSQLFLVVIAILYFISDEEAGYPI